MTKLHCTYFMNVTIIEILDSVSNNSFFENNKNFINHILLIFKLNVYKFRERKFIIINNLIAKIVKGKRIEKQIALNNSKRQLLLEKSFGKMGWVSLSSSFFCFVLCVFLLEFFLSLLFVLFLLLFYISGFSYFLTFI